MLLCYVRKSRLLWAVLLWYVSTCFLHAGIVSFTATRETFLPGQQVVLSWDVTAGDTISISPSVGTVSGTTGSVTVVPTADTTYLLTNATSGTTASVSLSMLKAGTLKHRWSFNEGSGNTVIDSVAAVNGVIVPSSSTTPANQHSRSASMVTLPGGSSGTCPYIDLPNTSMSGLEEVTIEGWMTPIQPSGTNTRIWQRVFDFGTGTAAEVTSRGGTFSGVSYLFLALQNGTNTGVKVPGIRDDGTEQNISIADAIGYGAEFHFAYVYDLDGNAGSPQIRYYKNGVLMTSLNTPHLLTGIPFDNVWLGRSNWSADSNTQASYNELRIWNRSMSAERVADNAAAGADAFPSSVSIDSLTAFPALTIESGQTARLSYVIANPSGGSFTASINQGVGAVTGTDGFVSVTPTATTTYTLSVTAGAITRTANVTVTVTPGSNPVSENLSYQIPHNTTTAARVVANDYQTNSLSYSIVMPPANGVLSGTAPFYFYTPNAGFAGVDSFTYKANDGGLDSNTATVTLTVLPAPVAPTAITASDSVIYTDAVNGSFIARLRTVDDNPDDTFSYTLVNGVGDTHNAWFTLNQHQLLSARIFLSDSGVAVSIRVRVTDSAANSFEQVLTFPVSSRPQTVMIHEINYNPSRNTQASEFIELFNPTATAIDLSSWRLANAVDYLFPVGTIIPANGYLVIAENPAVIQSMYVVASLGPWTGGLSSQGESIELRNAVGNVVDRVDFGNSAPWPTAPNGDGASLELVNGTFDNNVGGAWSASISVIASQTYLGAGSVGWQYFKGTREASTPMTAWRAESFNDSAWTSATMPLGIFKINSDTASSFNAETGVTLATQINDMATFNGSSFTTAYNSVFLRKNFTVSGAIPRALVLRVMRNDAAIVYINGTEVARFGFSPDAPAEPAYNSTAIYERANDPWSDILWLNSGTLLHQGTNTMAIHAYAKPPQLRANQEDVGVYQIFDFCVDADLRTPAEMIGTPGAANSSAVTNAAPPVRNVDHSPSAPKPWESIKITARVSDAQGLGSVQLVYQVCTAGNYIPATLPRTTAQVLADASIPPPANPAFEEPTNWTVIPMTDAGGVNDQAGDGIFTAVIPAQAHRTLIRYRIVATDLTGNIRTIPAANDPRRNFAAYSYHCVPNFTAGGTTYTADTLDDIPVYQLLMRPADFTSLLAYNGGDQYANSSALNVLNARHYENFLGTMIVGDQVMDHTAMRLRGGNSRYMGEGKRHFRFNFPKGHMLQAYDEKGNNYGAKWESLLFNKLFGNKGAYDFGLPYEVGTKLWGLQGVPMPEATYVHFRVVRDADENHATNGDFWGLYQALELPEGKNFLDARNLPKGNFYKTTDWQQNGEMDQRYQAPGAPEFAEDFDNIRYNIHQTTAQSDIERYINMPLWYKYNAVQEAIRHYDIFTEPTGRHRVKNLIWYFHPTENSNGLGQLWYMPYDWDASFGPNWNNGWDNTHNAIYNHDTITDSPTWQLPMANRDPMKIAHRNAIREFRDLVWYREPSTGRGPFDDIIDDAMAPIAQFYQADMARWPNNAGAAGYWPGGAPAKVQDMKNFSFVSWSDPFGGDPAVGAGGRAAHLDAISDAIDSGLLPATPTITYNGAPSFPVDGLAFASSAFADPQGSNTFQAMQWRIGEVTDANAPAYDPLADRIYEVTPVWESGTRTSFASTQLIPGAALRVGHSYRARVRHQDSSGRWSHWSAPVSFTTTISNYVEILKQNLMISEIMYHPDVPSAAEAAAGFVESDFEYIELLNISPSLTLDLTNVRFTKGIDFDWAFASSTSLAPGQRVLIVKKQAAFVMRYGVASVPIVGEWDLLDSLSNNGEQLKLSYGAGVAINDFVYDDLAPWPTAADTGFYSLVLFDPMSAPNHGIGINWRASYVIKGTPGSSEFTSYAEWAAHWTLSDPAGDPDCDAVANRLEYILGGDPSDNDVSILPKPSRQGANLVLEFQRRDGAEWGEMLMLQSSSNLSSWPLASEVLLGSSSVAAGELAHGISYTIEENGTEPDDIRITIPILDAPRFWRLQTSW